MGDSTLRRNLTPSFLSLFTTGPFNEVEGEAYLAVRSIAVKLSTAFENCRNGDVTLLGSAGTRSLCTQRRPRAGSNRARTTQQEQARICPS